MHRWLLTLTLSLTGVLAASPAAGESPPASVPTAATSPSPSGSGPASPDPGGLKERQPWSYLMGDRPCLSPEPALYSAQTLCAGETVPAAGFLMHPRRFREAHRLLTGTLPACEWARDRCQVRLEECQQAGTPPPSPISPPSEAGPWPGRLAWAAGGLAVGLASGVALALWGASL